MYKKFNASSYLVKVLVVFSLFGFLVSCGGGGGAVGINKWWSPNDTIVVHLRMKDSKGNTLASYSGHDVRVYYKWRWDDENEWKAASYEVSDSSGWVGNQWVNIENLNAVAKHRALLIQASYKGVKYRTAIPVISLLNKNNLKYAQNDGTNIYSAGSDGALTQRSGYLYEGNCRMVTAFTEAAFILGYMGNKDVGKYVCDNTSIDEGKPAQSSIVEINDLAQWIISNTNDFIRPKDDYNITYFSKLIEKYVPEMMDEYSQVTIPLAHGLIFPDNVNVSINSDSTIGTTLFDGSKLKYTAPGTATVDQVILTVNDQQTARRLSINFKVGEATILLNTVINANSTESIEEGALSIKPSQNSFPTNTEISISDLMLPDGVLPQDKIIAQYDIKLSNEPKQPVTISYTLPDNSSYDSGDIVLIHINPEDGSQDVILPSSITNSGKTLTFELDKFSPIIIYSMDRSASYACNGGAINTACAADDFKYGLKSGLSQDLLVKAQLDYDSESRQILAKMSFLPEFSQITSSLFNLTRTVTILSTKNATHWIKEERNPFQWIVKFQRKRLIGYETLGESRITVWPERDGSVQEADTGNKYWGTIWYGSPESNSNSDSSLDFGMNSGGDSVLSYAELESIVRGENLIFHSLPLDSIDASDQFRVVATLRTEQRAGKYPEHRTIYSKASLTFKTSPISINTNFDIAFTDDNNNGVEDLYEGYTPTRSVTNIEFTSASYDLVEGVTFTPELQVTYSDRTSAIVSDLTNVVFSSQDINIVDNARTALAPGNTTITATYLGASTSVTVSVRAREIITMPASASANIGDVITLQPIDGVASSYLSSDTSIATVNSSGEVTALAEGVVLITAFNTDGNSDSTTLEVLDFATGYILKPSSLEVEVGRSIQLKIYQTYASGKEVDLTSDATFSVVDAGVASITISGLVTGIATGETTVLVTLTGGIELTGTITVTPYKKRLNGSYIVDVYENVISGSPNLNGGVIQIKLFVTYDDGSSKDVTGLASISYRNSSYGSSFSNGIISYKYYTSSGYISVNAWQSIGSPGECLLFTYSDEFGTLSDESGSGGRLFCVTNTILSGILMPSTASVDVGKSITISPLQGTTAVSYSSGDTTVATVTNSGVVTGISAGTVWITGFNSNGNSDSTYVTVTGFARSYAIGDTGPAGGIVFYITDNGTHGLEAAPIDQASSDVAWGCDKVAVSGADGTVVGSGAQNTADILLVDCSLAVTAAKLADSYVLNGYSDWFLPSKEELNYLYLQKDVVGGFSTTSWYWSSSEYSVWTSDAWMQHFYDGEQGVINKSAQVAVVRAIRTF